MQTKWMTAGFLVAVAAVMFTGCGKAPTKPNAAVKNVSSGHSHDGWWCDEHGVPEEKCGLCDAKLAEKFKADGDWCKEHDRPESQCFVCNPAKEAEFAAEYEAKYGKKPPKPTDTGAEAHDHDHDHKHDHKHDEKS
jgi:hypothetical protein